MKFFRKNKGPDKEEIGDKLHIIPVEPSQKTPGKVPTVDPSEMSRLLTEINRRLNEKSSEDYGPN